MEEAEWVAPKPILLLGAEGVCPSTTGSQLAASGAASGFGKCRKARLRSVPATFAKVPGEIGAPVHCTPDVMRR